VAVVSAYSRSTEISKFIKDALPTLGKFTFVKFPHSSDHNALGNAGKTDDEFQSPGLECIAKYLKEEEKSESQKSCWQFISSIVNRAFLLFIFILSLIEILIFVC